MSLALTAQISAAALSPVEQGHLDQARQMQALSFAVHWASGYVLLPVLGVYKPIWKYDLETLAK
jgi:hypothetical protein